MKFGMWMYAVDYYERQGSCSEKRREEKRREERGEKAILGDGGPVVEMRPCRGISVRARLASVEFPLSLRVHCRAGRNFWCSPVRPRSCLVHCYSCCSHSTSTRFNSVQPRKWITLHVMSLVLSTMTPPKLTDCERWTRCPSHFIIFHYCYFSSPFGFRFKLYLN